MNGNIISFGCSVIVGYLTVLLLDLAVPNGNKLILNVVTGLVAGLTFVIVRKRLESMRNCK